MSAQIGDIPQQVTNGSTGVKEIPATQNTDIIDDARVPTRLGQVSQAIIANALQRQTNIPINVLAGGYDLHAFLSMTNMPPQGRLIILRPLIHCMAMYIWQDGAQFKCYWFDSQAWLNHYYPNRIIAQALNAVYPGIEIYVNKTLVQIQESGCYNYSFEVVQRIIARNAELRAAVGRVASGDAAMPTSTEQIGGVTVHVINDAVHDPIFVGGQDATGRALAKLSDLDVDQSERSLREISKQQLVLLAQKSGDLNCEANKVREEMQGLSLLEQPRPLLNEFQRNLYTITISQDSDGSYLLKISFSDKDHLLYGGLLKYSSAIYPGGIKDNCTNIFAPERIKEETATEIVYSFNSLEEINVELNSLRRQVPTLFGDKYLTQSLGFSAFIDDAQETVACALAERKDDKGGIYPFHTTQALQYLVNSPSKKALVLPCTEGQEAANLLPLSVEKLLRWVLIPYAQARTAHQILIALDTEQKRLIIYDSEGQENPKLIELIIKRNLPEIMQDYRLVDGQDIIPYSRQTDGWSCGVHVVAAGCCLLEGKEINPNLAEKPISKSPLDTKQWLWKIIRAENNQRKIDVYLVQERQQNFQIKQFLLWAVCEVSSQHQQLQKLEEALQMEVWGNLDRNNPNRKPQQHALVQGRSLSGFKDCYSQKNPDDNYGERLLQILGVLNIKDPAIITADFINKLSLLVEHYYPASVNILFTIPYDDRVTFLLKETTDSLVEKIEKNWQQFIDQEKMQKIEGVVEIELKGELLDHPELLQQYRAAQNLQAFEAEHQGIFANIIKMRAIPEYGEVAVNFVVCKYFEFAAGSAGAIEVNQGQQHKVNEGFSDEAICSFAEFNKRKVEAESLLKKYCPEVFDEKPSAEFDEDSAETFREIILFTQWFVKENNYLLVQPVINTLDDETKKIFITRLVRLTSCLKNIPLDNSEVFIALFKFITSAPNDDIDRDKSSLIRHIICNFGKQFFSIVCDLSGVSLDGIDLSSANLIGISFANTSLQKVNFTDANLQNVDFRGAILDNGTAFHLYLWRGINDFSNCTLIGDLRGVDFTSRFGFAKFDNVKVRDAILDKRAFQSLRGCKIRSFRCCKFVGDFQGVDFADIDLTNANFKEANLTNTKVENAILNNSRFGNLYRSGIRNFYGCCFYGDFSGNRFR